MCYHAPGKANFAWSGALEFCKTLSNLTVNADTPMGCRVCQRFCDLRARVGRWWLWKSRNVELQMHDGFQDFLPCKPENTVRTWLLLYTASWASWACLACIGDAWRHDCCAVSNSEQLPWRCRLWGSPDFAACHLLARSHQCRVVLSWTCEAFLLPELSALHAHTAVNETWCCVMLNGSHLSLQISSAHIAVNDRHFLILYTRSVCSLVCIKYRQSLQHLYCLLMTIIINGERRGSIASALDNVMVWRAHQ